MLDWAGAAEHPKGSFTLTSIEGSGTRYNVSGSLEFHGVSRPVEFPVEIAPAGSELNVSGRVTIDYRDWGLKQFRKFLVIVVDPMVTVNFSFKVRSPE